jgi:hypothetical protein
VSCSIVCTDNAYNCYHYRAVRQLVHDLITVDGWLRVRQWQGRHRCDSYVFSDLVSGAVLCSKHHLCAIHTGRADAPAVEAQASFAEPTPVAHVSVIPATAVPRPPSFTAGSSTTPRTVGASPPPGGTARITAPSARPSARLSLSPSSAQQPPPTVTPRSATTSPAVEGETNNSLLLWAAANANDLIMLRELLIKTDADVNWVNEVRGSARCCATLATTEHITLCTLQKGETALHQACYKGHTDCARLLVAKAADLDVQDQDLWTTLHQACYKGHTEIVQLLISKGADLTLRKRVSGLSGFDCGGSVQQLSISPFLCVQNGTAYECACNEEVRALFPSSIANGPAASPSARAPPQSNPASPAARSPAQSASSKAAPACAGTGEGPSLSLGQQLWHSVDRGDVETTQELLLTEGVDVNYRNEVSLLCVALQLLQFSMWSLLRRFLQRNKRRLLSRRATEVTLRSRGYCSTTAPIPMLRTR